MVSVTQDNSKHERGACGARGLLLHKESRRRTAGTPPQPLQAPERCGGCGVGAIDAAVWKKYEGVVNGAKGTKGMEAWCRGRVMGDPGEDCWLMVGVVGDLVYQTRVKKAWEEAVQGLRAVG